VILITSKNGNGRITHSEGIFAGQSVFLCGSSPNLVSQPLELLNRGSTLVASVGHAANYVDSDLWFGAQPVDSYRVTEGIRKPGTMSFAPAARVNEITREGVRYEDYPNTFFFYPDSDVPLGEILAPRQGTPWYKSTLMSAIPILYHLGFRTIYMVGFSFGKVDDELYPHKVSHNQMQQRMTEQVLETSLEQLKSIKDVVKSYGLRIVDCSISGRLESTYESMTLEAAVEESTSAFPDIPVSELVHPSNFVSVVAPESMVKKGSNKLVVTEGKTSSGPTMRTL